MTPARLPVPLTEEAHAELAERAATAARLDRPGRSSRPREDERRLPAHGRFPRQHHRSRRHADATGDGRTHLGYQDHYVVDGGRARIILTALVTPAEVQENQPALDLLWRARFRWKLRPRQVTGDTKYGTIENIAAIERRASAPISRCRRPVSEPGSSGSRTSSTTRPPIPTAVREGRGCASCPTARTRSRRIYEAPAAACAACALRPQCTTSKRGRRMGRSIETRRTGAGAQLPHDGAVRQGHAQTQVWVEPLFAEAKDWHGLRRFRLRGLEKVNGEALLIAAGQNLKRLLSRRGWGRRPFPSGAAGIVLPALPPASPDAVIAASTPTYVDGGTPLPSLFPFSTGWSHSKTGRSAERNPYRLFTNTGCSCD